MNMPQSDRAEVSQTKIVGYLLDASHPENGGKAQFFLGWGFEPNAWRILADALIELAKTTDVAEAIPSAWGVKYVIDGPLQSPRGVTPPVRTVWIVEAESTTPRLVTAYPAD